MRNHRKHTRIWPVLALLFFGALIANVGAAWRHDLLNRDLRQAAILGDTADARMLLDCGADPNTWMIAAPKSPEFVNKFATLVGLRKYPRERICMAGYFDPLLSHAARYGRADIVKLLLEKGANPNARDLQGDTPIIAAAEAGNAEVLLYLVRRGADVNARSHEGCTSLMNASTLAWLNTPAHTRFALLLIDHGADVNARDKSGLTALWRAKNMNNIPLIAALERSGAR